MGEKDSIDSLIGWWRDAGVDTIVSDAPGGWLHQAGSEERKAPATATAARPDNAAKARPAARPMPDTLPEFSAWLTEETMRRGALETIDAAGDPTSGLMVLVDMPEPEDADAGHLLSGEAGLLFDRMLAAIGRDRASIYLAPQSPERPLGGAIAENQREFFAEAARRHVALAAPKWLLCMGDAPSRAFCGSSLNEARGKQDIFNHDGGTVSVIATFHPRTLLMQPRFKAQCWKDLQMLIEGMSA